MWPVGIDSTWKPAATKNTNKKLEIAGVDFTDKHSPSQSLTLRVLKSFEALIPFSQQPWKNTWSNLAT
jgi:hypothetical protein